MNEKLFESLKWRCAGPFRGGRVVAVAGHPTERATFYHGACAGGVWKTTDGGNIWENISDGYMKTSAVGAIAVAESDPNVIYIGTGETAIRGNVSHGDGVYKTTDGGRSWKNVGLKDTRHIGRVRIHPENANIVYVAALGHAWGPNDERGVFRTTDGGETWERVLHVSDRAGAVDMSMNPQNPREIYATIWQAQRYPHALSSGGPDSGLWKTTDGGDTWTDITRNPGLPQGTVGKIGVAIAPSMPQRVYALVEAEDGALFRSDDSGATWQRLCEDGRLRTRAWYYMHVFAHPTDPDTVWVLNMPSLKSIDGGKTFLQVPTPHGDNHDLWIDPTEPDRMIQGDDGGAFVSFNGGLSWSTILNQPTAQFYHVITDNAVPYRIYGSQQDNSAIRIPSLSFYGAITDQDWTIPGGGESGYLAIQDEAPHLVFGGGIGSGPGLGRMTSWNPETDQTRAVNVWPDQLSMGEGAIEGKYRFQWTYPIHLSPHNQQTLYVGGNHLFRSRDNATSFDIVSPDLTRNDPEKLQASGGPITRDNTGAETYCTIFAFAESPHQEGVLWVGTDDGLMHISKDGGDSWTEITPPADLLPEWALISTIDLSVHSEGTAYVAATRYKHDDTSPYLLKTSNYGQTWQLITNSIPADDFTRVVREDPNRKGLLYAGGETGLHISFDDGENWQPFQGNLPVTPIHDLVIKGTDLLVATHGRSFWVLDDISPLHQMQDDLAGKAVHLYKPRPTYRWRIYHGYGSPSEDPDFVSYINAGPISTAYTAKKGDDNRQVQTVLNAGTNPPDGTIIHYWLRETPTDAVKLTILDAKGNLVRSYSSETDDKDEVKITAHAGANRFVWDFLYEPPVKVKKSPDMEHGNPFGGGKEDAPRALPGGYQVRLEAGGQVLTESFEVLADPRIPATLADLQAQFDLKVQIRDTISSINIMLNQVEDLKGQVKSWVDRANTGGENRAVTDAALVVTTKLDAVAGELVHPQADSPLQFPSRLKEKLISLSEMIDEADGPPTFGSYEVFEEHATRVRVQQDLLKRVVEEDLPAFNRKLAEAGVQAIEV